MDSGSRNPYKLVFKVLKFAKDHTNPIRGSNFTYYEDELPSRLDLGKEKYGGPFTTEHVKAFIGIWTYSPWIYCYQRKFVLRTLAIKSYIGIIIILAMPI